MDSIKVEYADLGDYRALHNAKPKSLGYMFFFLVLLVVDFYFATILYHDGHIGISLLLFAVLIYFFFFYIQSLLYLVQYNVLHGEKISDKWKWRVIWQPYNLFVYQMTFADEREEKLYVECNTNYYLKGDKLHFTIGDKKEVLTITQMGCYKHGKTAGLQRLVFLPKRKKPVLAPKQTTQG